jgi:hypothetical protein
MSMLNECIGMDLTTYLIRQYVATKREEMQREFEKELVPSFTCFTTAYKCVPWKSMTICVDGYTRDRYSHFVQVQKDVWSFKPNGLPSSFSSYPGCEVLSVPDWQLRYEGIDVHSPDKGTTYYMSKTAYYQDPVTQTVEQYKKVIDSYKERVKELCKWESECLAMYNAKSDQLPSIDLRNCFSQIWDMTMPSPMYDIVEQKKTSVCSKLAEEFEINNNIAEKIVDGKQIQQTHVEAETFDTDILNKDTEEKSTLTDKRSPTCAQGKIHNIKRQMKQRRLLEEIDLLKNIPNTSSPIESMNQPKKVVIALNNPKLNVEALYLNRPTHTELLKLISYNTLSDSQKLGEGSFLVKCLQTLYNTIECDALDIPTRYQIMIAHLALRLFDFTSCEYVDKYRKWIGANDIWASEANLSTLDTASRSTIIWVKNNTPSVFLTNPSVQELFQKVLTVDDSE